MSTWIPVSQPAFLGNERAYVDRCMETQWISSIGEFIPKFEAQFASILGVESAISCCNGTVALHLSLLGLGIGPGDEVLVPSLTYVASVNAITYVGAQPVFVDSDRETWNLSVDDLRRKVTPRTKAILVVHLYGRPAAITEICELAREIGLSVIEDVAEALGAKYDGRMLGTFGDVAAFSFFGNKIVTTGEGGMVVARDPTVARRILQLKGQGQDFERRYWFPVVGYNYRMTNIAAAIGLAQLECFDEHLRRRSEIDAWYREELASMPDIKLQEFGEREQPVCWLFSVILERVDAAGRVEVMRLLATEGIDSRPFFYPCHTLPPYRAGESVVELPNAEWLSARGLSLPTWIGIDRGRVEVIARNLQRCCLQLRGVLEGMS